MLLFPSDPEELRKDIWEEENDSSDIESIAKAVTVYKQRSYERRILNAALARNLKGPTMYGLVHGDQMEGLRIREDNVLTQKGY